MPIAEILDLSLSSCKIAALRKAAGLSQAALGHLVGLDARTVWKIETMDRGHIPKAITLFRIAVALDTTVEELYVVKAKTRKRPDPPK